MVEWTMVSDGSFWGFWCSGCTSSFQHKAPERDTKPKGRNQDAGVSRLTRYTLYTLHTHYAHSAHTQYSHCTLSAHTLRTHCKHTTLTLHTHCTLTAHTLHSYCTHCTHTVKTTAFTSEGYKCRERYNAPIYRLFCGTAASSSLV